MVSKSASTLLRPAVAMIELIFALVIMGIVLMSAPQLIATAQKSSINSIQQEGIAMAASHINMVLSRFWDEANTNINLPVTILRTTTDTVVANQNGLEPNTIVGNPREGLRTGTPRASLSRSYRDANGNPIQVATAQNAMGIDVANDGNIEDDMDDYDNTISTLRLSGAAGGDDYVDTQMQMQTFVTYINDSPNPAAGITRYNTNTATLTYNLHPGLGTAMVNVARSTHIKYITVQLTQGQAAQAALSAQINLEAFACNIGRQNLDEIPIP